MDDYVVNTFANRDAPIPVISIPDAADGASDDGGSTLDSEQLSQSTDRDGVSGGPPHTPSHKRSSSLQDRVLTKLLQQVVPTGDDHHGSTSLRWTPSSSKHLSRPGFSLPQMTSNFRRFNARIGVVFVFQANCIRLFTWQKASHTLSFLALYSFVCIYPYLLVVLPFCMVLFFVMVPSYLARHPPPPTPAPAMAPRQALDGPPIAPARVIKPANEMSHDFFYNMRDLQNCMGDFAVIHDLVLDAVTPYTNFANQELSSAVFLILTCAIFCLYLVAPLVPWRWVGLVGGWATVLMGHPDVQAAAARAASAGDVASHRGDASKTFHGWVARDMCMDEAPEVLEVEIFELQHRRLPPSFQAEAPSLSASPPSDGEPASSSPPPRLPPRRHYAPLAAAEWEPWLFSGVPWEPQTPGRLAGERPRGTRFFEDVRPPPGWAWAGKKWMLDLEGQAWVQDRLLGGLEVEVEGERWVYDLVGGGRFRRDATRAASRKARKAAAAHEPDDDEPVFRGEWRRRRWVRSVKRAKVGGKAARVLSDDAPRQEPAKARW